uniref:Glutathione S transferase class theta variant 8 n=1 Tax=Periplaneta americana TaxID=6978 RepID=G8XWV2_PERAM|nr:glutathione S transferase class theta variant 8 [Periplaneta americana]
MPIDFYYFDASAPCQSIMMLAKTLGVELNLKEITLSAGDHRKPEFVQMNPQHCVPTINDNGFILWESRVILGYLVETYGKDDSLYPKDPKKRALVNQRLYFDIGTLYPKYILYYMPIIYQGTSPDPAHVAGFEQPLEFLEKFLEGNEWVAGNDITIADYTIGVTVSHMEAVGYDLKKHPNISRWLEKTKNTIPSYSEIMGVGIPALLDLLEKSVKK